MLSGKQRKLGMCYFADGDGGDGGAGTPAAETTVETPAVPATIETPTDTPTETPKPEEKPVVTPDDDDDDENYSYFEDEKPKEPEVKTPEEPQKIKIGEKEYTPEEIQQAFEEKNKPLEESFRPPLEIKKDYEAASLQSQRDFDSFKQRFITKSMVEAESEYTAQGLFDYGVQTGDFTAFISTLTPIDAIAFENERQQGIKKYDEILKNLEDEYNKSSLNEKKSLDAQAYSAYKAKNNNFKDNPFISHLLDNFVSKNYHFNENMLAEFTAAIQKARDFEAEQQKANSLTQDGKDRMIKSPANSKGTTPADKYAGIPRSWKEIDKKGQNWYNNNSELLDEMDAKGLLTP